MAHPLFPPLTTFVNNCMSAHDPSHNPAHVHRVVALARTILSNEQRIHPEIAYDAAVVDLAALLHDIGDRKYLAEVAATVSALKSSASTTRGQGEGGEESLDPTQLVRHALISHGADEALAERVQTIVSNVSYTNETKYPEKVRALIAGGNVELGIVQDADRLDALGAIGIGRCFTFLGAQGKRFVGEGEAWEMENSIRHFVEKLERLEGMMKTETGRDMARVRTKRLVEFRGWWEEEMQGV